MKNGNGSYANYSANGGWKVMTLSLPVKIPVSIIKVMRFTILIWVDLRPVPCRIK